MSCCCSVTKSCPTLWDRMDCSPHYLPEFAQTYVHLVSDAIQPSHTLSPPSLPTLNLCQHQGLFQWAGSLHQVAKVWSFSFSINPSNEYSGLISFRIDRFDLKDSQVFSMPQFKNVNSWCSDLKRQKRYDTRRWTMSN